MSGSKRQVELAPSQKKKLSRTSRMWNARFLSLSLSLSLSLPLYVSIYPSIYLSIYLYIYLSIERSEGQSIAVSKVCVCVHIPKCAGYAANTNIAASQKIRSEMTTISVVGSSTKLLTSRNRASTRLQPAKAHQGPCFGQQPRRSRINYLPKHSTPHASHYGCLLLG